MATWPQPNSGIAIQFAAYVLRTAAYSASAGDFVLANATSAGFNVTLPPVSQAALVAVKKTDASGNAVTVETSDESTIDGLSSISLGYEYATATLVSDGAAWHVVSHYITTSEITSLAAASASAAVAAVQWNFKTKTASTYAAVAYDFVLANPSGAQTIDLPTPATVDQAVAVKNITTNPYTVTVKTTDGSTIDGIAGATGVALAAALDSFVFVFDGTNWWSQSGGPVVAAS
jgi:hypothetical protein